MKGKGFFLYYSLCSIFAIENKNIDNKNIDNSKKYDISPENNLKGNSEENKFEEYKNDNICEDSVNNISTNITEDKKNNKNINKGVNSSNKTYGKCCKEFLNKVNEYEDEGSIINNIRFSVSKIDKFNNAFKITFKLNSIDNSPLFKLDPRKFHIYLVDEKGIELKDKIITSWKGEPIYTGDSLYKIKKSFLSQNNGFLFVDKKSGKNTISDPFSISLKLAGRLNKKVFIKIVYKIGELEKIIVVDESLKNLIDKNNNLFDLYAFYSVFDEEYKEIFQKIVGKVGCFAVTNNKNAIKIKFPEETEMLKGDFKSKLVLFIYDENGNIINENVLYKWLPDKNNKNVYITNGTELVNIKRGFLSSFKNSEYKNDPYSISMRVDDSKYKKIKIKIYFSDELNFFVKYNDSEIIDLKDFCGSKIVETEEKCTDDDYRKIVSEIFKCGVRLESGFLKNTIKIIFNEEKMLIDKTRKDYFKIFIYDNNNVECKSFEDSDWLIAKWFLKDNKYPVAIKSGSKLSDIKHLFLTNSLLYPSNDPFAISMRVNGGYVGQGFKIKIVYDDGKGNILETDFLNIDDALQQ